MRTDFSRLLDFATCNTAPTDKLVKLRDGGGLYLHIKPSGRRGWRFYYTRPGSKKQNTLSFGTFPEVPIGDARAKCDAARVLLAKGIDPSANDKEVKRAAVAATVGAATFLAFTNFEVKNAAGEIEVGPWWRFAMIDDKSRVSGKTKCKQTLRRTAIHLRKLQAALGDRPIAEIQSGEILAVLDKLSRNSASRVQQIATHVFDLAVARMVCKYNVATPCKNAIAKHIKEKMPAVTDHISELGLPESEALVGVLMARVRDYRKSFMAGKALEMMALTFPRPHNIVEMKWTDIKADVWAIGGSDMKMRKPHKIWLSRQAQAILDVMRPITGAGERVFPVKKETLTNALKAMGYDTKPGGDQSVHGFRSIASTLLNESGKWSSDAIELSLAHRVGGRDGRAGGVRGVYNKAERMDERKAMMQFWADYLDRLRDGNVVTLTKAA
jgi:integrase